MNYDTLPANFSRIRTVDMKEKKLCIRLNVSALAFAALLVVPVLFLVPFRTQMAKTSTLHDLLWLLLYCLSNIGFIFAHELLHGLAIRLLAKAKPTYGFTGLFAFCKCETKYIAKIPYYGIALAPLLLSVVRLGLCFWVPLSWFWVPYWVFVRNTSGAVGDLYITFLLLRLPKDCLIIDRGVAMEIYSKEDAVT
jgi:hypothetical protein